MLSARVYSNTWVGQRRRRREALRLAKVASNDDGEATSPPLASDADAPSSNGPQARPPLFTLSIEDQNGSTSTEDTEGTATPRRYYVRLNQITDYETAQQFAAVLKQRVKLMAAACRIDSSA